MRLSFTPQGSASDSQSPFWETATFKIVLTAVTVLGFALPAIAYLWVIPKYGVNAVFGDQWSDVILIGLSHSGHLSLAALWAQHNENRIFFPNLIVLFLADATHFNIKIELYLSAFMLLTSI